MPSGTRSHAAEPVMSRPVVANASRATVEEPGDRLQRRRLPGAVRADQRDELALAHFEVDALHRLDAAVAHFERLSPQARVPPR